MKDFTTKANCNASLIQNPNGTFDFSVRFPNLRLRQRGKREHWLIDGDGVIPVRLEIDGHIFRPRLITKLFVKLSDGDLARLRIRGDQTERKSLQPSIV